MDALLIALFEVSGWLTGRAVEPLAGRSLSWARIVITLLAVVVALILTLAAIALLVVGWGVVTGLGE